VHPILVNSAFHAGVVRVAKIVMGLRLGIRGDRSKIMVNVVNRNTQQIPGHQTPSLANINAV